MDVIYVERIRLKLFMLKNLLYNSSEKMSQTVAAMTTTTTKNMKDKNLWEFCVYKKKSNNEDIRKIIIFIQFYRFYNRFNLLDLNDIICSQFQSISSLYVVLLVTD